MHVHTSNVPFALVEMAEQIVMEVARPASNRHLFNADMLGHQGGADREVATNSAADGRSWDLRMLRVRFLLDSHEGELGR